MKYLIALLLILASCGKSPHVQTIDKDLQLSVTKYEYLFGRQVFSDVILVKDLGPNIDGNCHQESGSSVVSIRISSWNRLKAMGQEEQLIFHELSHCTFGLVHNYETRMLSGHVEPTSLMYPFTFAAMGYNYNANRDYYYNELRQEIDSKSLGFVEIQ